MMIEMIIEYRYEFIEIRDSHAINLSQSFKDVYKRKRKKKKTQT